MLFYITLLLVCQLAGEVVARMAGLPVPGPVVGMVILFVGLVVKGGVPSELERVGTALLSHLSLLFVPAGVGVMIHLGLIADEWLPISAALIASTLVTIAVTAWVMAALGRRP
ncbi:MAG: CidA/LrgA family protein [Pseudomonadota bacterium]